MSTIAATAAHGGEPALSAGATSQSHDEPRLRELCAQLEGVFLEQLMKALRETVPESGLTGGGAGEEIFSSLLDGHISNLAAGRLEHGLGAALYRQLRGAGGAVR